MIPNIEEEIKRHTEEVRRGKLSPENRQCPYCKGRPQFFSIHEKRERQFLVFVVEVVKKIVSLLIRWKCPLCKRKFTEYPEFAMPYKRHVKETVTKLSGKYVFDESPRGRVTYKEAVEVKRLPIGYVDKEGNPQEHYISPSTVWKWIGCLGSGSWLEKMLSMIKEKEPQTGIFREVKIVAVYKYRSEKRKTILERCMKYLEAAVDFKRLFGFSPSSP
jgi:transposase-like protein